MRAWNEFVARLGDVVPVPLIGLILFAVAGLTALLWYWWPEWFRGLRRIRLRRPKGWRWRRPRWPKWRRRRRRQPSETEPEPAAPEELAPDELPEVPSGVLALNADELAAQGRYREAVRERLRAIVRDLVERKVIDSRPGWTLTELAGQAGRVQPATATPLAAASHVFSEIWYGGREATATDDLAIRGHAEQVRAALTHWQVPA